MNITPIFRSSYSLGKSILTCALPDEKRSKDMSDSIFDIAVENSLSEVYIVDNCLAGIFECAKNALKLKIELRFGLEIKVGTKEAWFKHILMAANAEGVKELFQIFSSIQTKHEGVLPIDDLAEIDPTNLNQIIPFYDSYLDKNLRCFGTFIPKFSGPVYYSVENNNLPIDRFIKRKIEQIGGEIIRTKTILYKNKEDFIPWQVYKIACNDKMGGKRPTFESPNLDGCGSNEFCFESYLENAKADY